MAGGLRLTRGIVLAGGKSTRYGEDKSLALYKGKPFVRNAVDILRAAGLKPAVVTRRGMRYDFLDCRILWDKLPEKGPLGGLYTAMTAFSGETLVVITCDMPALTPSALMALAAASRPDDELTVFLNGGEEQPFPGVYAAKLYGEVRNRLLEGRLAMRGLLESGIRKTAVPCAEGREIFLNVNRREDLLIS